MPGPATLRYGGLAGSLLLAVAAYVRGAHTPWSPPMTARTILSGADGWLVPLCWLAGTLLLVAAWWLGRHRVPSLRWAYVTAALWALPLLFVLPLGSYDVYSYACQGWALTAGHDPYAAGVAAYQCPWLDAVAPTWRSSPAPYGPVFLLLAALTTVAGGSLTGTLALLRVIAVLGVVLLAAGLPALARRHDVDPGRAVFLAVACPLVPIHLISGAHNDAVMVGLLVAGLALVFRERPAWLLAAGALIGLAGGVKATALVVLPFVVLPLRRNWWVALGAVLSLGLASLASGLGFGWLFALAGSGVSVQWTSPPTAVGMTASLLGAGDTAITVARLVGLAALALLLITLWWRFALRTHTHPLVVRQGLPESAQVRGAEAVDPDPEVPVGAQAGESHQRRPARTNTQVSARRGVVARLEVSMSAQSKGAGLALVATVALAPVFHPWYLTWPLAVLAATLRRDTRWLVVPCAVASVLCLPDGYNLALAAKAQGAIAMTVVVVGVVVYAVRWRRRS
ncbi:polyprenol phosphomannose-dependent alpha 1,6 mannosyltransferase MptB [Actinoplanes sp. NPDC089786]|uniref:polyprenol phosphomannose-dependent alpha 1,6 mannosyltransferase MptB n=1 Tax=Actinoplanes sp. NPDC089786 TaxID=3155185 RepID=UPI0034403209